MGGAGRFDCIVAAHLLNELSLAVDGRARLVLGLVSRAARARGHLHSRRARASRDLARALWPCATSCSPRDLFVVAPCLWQGPCPALLRERDFCHASADVLVQGRSRVDFSYLVLRKQRACPERYLAYSAS